MQIKKKNIHGYKIYVCPNCGGLCGSCDKCDGPLKMVSWEPIILECVNCGKTWDN